MSRDVAGVRGIPCLEHAAQIEHARMGVPHGALDPQLGLEVIHAGRCPGSGSLFGGLSRYVGFPWSLQVARSMAACLRAVSESRAE